MPASVRCRNEKMITALRSSQCRIKEVHRSKSRQIIMRAAVKEILSGNRGTCGQHDFGELEEAPRERNAWVPDLRSLQPQGNPSIRGDQPDCTLGVIWKALKIPSIQALAHAK